MVAELEREEADERPETSAFGHIAVTRANAEQLPGLFKQLTLEHVDILEQLLALQHKAARGNDPQPLLSSTVRAIVAHEAAETAVLYPRLSEHAKTRHDMSEHEDSAHNLTRLGHLLERLASTSEYVRSLEELIAQFQQHSRHEETELFVSGQHVLDAEDPALRDAYLEARRFAEVELPLDGAA